VAQPSLRRGSVTGFDADTGLGTVDDGATGATYLFHCTQIAGGSRHINPGVAVTFWLAPGRGGRWEAVEVSPLD
jgi:cold shock CspA family protein